LSVRRFLVSELEFLKARRAAEFPAFKSVLDALPRERWDYTPHERSPSARQIAWTLALETQACSVMVDEGRVEWKPVDPPQGVEAVKGAFDEAYKGLDERLARLDDKAWQESVALVVGGKVAREWPLGDFLWFFFFDAIHHRGQLSTYIRPMGGRVPAIYGPSGDESPAG
jgi:uncharacterized damage-inducible protein DinB